VHALLSLATACLPSASLSLLCDQSGDCLDRRRLEGKIRPPAANADNWFPATVDFRATAVHSGGAGEAATFDQLLTVIATKKKGSIRELGLVGHANQEAFEGNIIDCSEGIGQGIEDLESAIAYGRGLPGVRPGPVLLVGHSRGGFSSVHYAGLKPAEVLGVVNFSGGWLPIERLAKSSFGDAGRGAGAKVPQVWLYADDDNLYSEALIRSSYQAFATAGGSARFELLHAIPGDGHLLRSFPTGGGRLRTSSWQRSTGKGPKRPTVSRKFYGPTAGSDDSVATHDPSVGVRRRHLPLLAQGEGGSPCLLDQLRIHGAAINGRGVS